MAFDVLKSWMFIFGGLYASHGAWAPRTVIYEQKSFNFFPNC